MDHTESSLAVTLDDEPPGLPPHRVELFSDGVLAIAMTLLVLDLAVGEFDHGNLSTALSQQRAPYVAFLISFVFIGVMWLNHYATFHQVRWVNTPVLWANLGVLLGAVVLPYPTAVLAAAFRDGNLADERVAITLYGMLAFAMGLSWAILFWIISRNPLLWSTPNSEPMWRRVTLWAGGGAFAYPVAIVLGLLTTPWVSVVLFFFLVLYRSTQASRINKASRQIRQQNARSAAAESGTAT
jgi:uncharacterized membrane protein